MRTLNVHISDEEFKKLGLKGESLSFSELLALLNKELVKLKLRKSLELAEKYNLSMLKMDDIDEEVKASRRAKSNN